MKLKKDKIDKILKLFFKSSCVGFAPLLSLLLVNPIIVFINFFGTKILVFKNKEWE